MKRLEQAILQHDTALDMSGAVKPPATEGRVAERSILVVPRALAGLAALLRLAEPLAAAQPLRELIITSIVDTTDLPTATAALADLRDDLRARGVTSRTAAFSSPAPGEDLVRLASQQDVDLLLLAAEDSPLEGHAAVVLEQAPCDVALVLEAGGPLRTGPVLVPFGAAEHDWAALELGAWIAHATGAPLRLMGTASDKRGDARDASRLLADASLIVQRTAGVAAEPLLASPGREGVIALAEGAGLLVVGLSERWRQEGLGRVRSEIAGAPPAPTVFVRRGRRPAGWRPAETRTRFTWSLAGTGHCMSAELPIGTVTFLFTDIEGSTQLLKELRDRYGEALEDHQRILREVVAEHGGHEIDTQGDSFFVAFRRAKDAVTAAIACQRRLAEHAWPDRTELRVRMGIHTGEPAVGRERYVGLGVHRAARICAAGHGGQVLVSQTTRELLRDDPIEGVSFRDLGEHQLKDMDEPERIYQLTAPGLQADFAKLKTAAELAAGSSFAGYRIEDEVGRGGMGVVYRATDLRLERPVALKLITPELAADARFRERFLTRVEARCLARPSAHPARLFCRRGGRTALPGHALCGGSDLKRLVATEGTLAPERALRICGQVAAALDAAHEKGLVHRDVKPANVLLDDHEDGYLADFGLTKQLARGESATATEQLVGTLDYLAPEQIRGEDLDGRTDEYALACLLYECLAGKPPFRKETEAEILWAHMQEAPPSVRDYPALSSVFEKGLAKAKEDRFVSCAELIAATRSALGLEGPAPTLGAVVLPRLMRHRRKLLAVGVLVLAAAATAAAVELTRPPGSPELVGDAVGAIDANTNRLASYTEVGSTPSNIAVGEGGVWVLNGDDQTVSQIDPQTKRIVKTFGTGGVPTDLAVGAGAVWVGNGASTPEAIAGESYTTGVSRIDPRTAIVTRKLRLPPRGPEPGGSGAFHYAGVSQLAVGAGSLWAINPNLTVSRFDAATGALVARVPVKAGSGITAGKEGVWVTGAVKPSVSRIDVRTNKVVETIPLNASNAVGIAVGAGSVWVSDPPDGLVWRIEPGPRPLTRSIDVGIGAINITFGNGAVWAANFVDGTVVRIDPRTNSVTKRFPLPGTPQGIAARAGSSWVTVVGGTKGGPLPAPACSEVVSGGARPDVLIASDFPLQGPQGGIARSMADAVRFIVSQHGFKAGKHTVGYQSCDDSTAQTGGADYFKCVSNAKAFAEHSSLVGIVGPYNSFCASVEIPIANRASGGALAMISPANTSIGLTRRGPGAAKDEPGKYYPTGVRNYVRLVTPEDVESAAEAVLAHQLGLSRIFVLRSAASGNYGVGLTSGFARAARRVGVGIAGSALWNPEAKSYTLLADKVARSQADGVFLGDDVFANGGQVVKALRARLGSKVTLIGGDGFSFIPDLKKAAGPAATGMYVSFAGVPNDGLGPTGRRFLLEFGATQPGGAVQSETYVPQAAQAAEVLLQAIARSDGTRSSVLRELRRANVKNGILGSFGFDPDGDATPAAVTIFRVPGGPGDPDLVSDFRGAVVDRVIRVPTSLLRPTSLPRP